MIYAIPTSIVIDVPAGGSRSRPLRGPQRRNRPGRVSLKIRLANPRVVGDISSLPLNKLLKECELDIFWHDVRWPLDFPLLHEELEVSHDFILELL